jgi:hypothetical protein
LFQQDERRKTKQTHHLGLLSVSNAQMQRGQAVMRLHPNYNKKSL